MGRAGVCRSVSSGGLRRRKSSSYHSDTAHIRSFDVNVPFMQLEVHEWDIHAISAGRSGAG
jgi:hypothetical protein